MGPKVRAAVEFLKGGGQKAIITDHPTLQGALRAKGGTTLEP
jgi:carbamate kinase